MNKALSKEALFSSAPIRKAVFSLAAPTVLSQLITVIYNMADTFFVGRLGDPLMVAAATVSMPLFMLLTAFANLFGIGGASLISRAVRKQGIHNRRKRTYSNSPKNIGRSKLRGFAVRAEHRQNGVFKNHYQNAVKKRDCGGSENTKRRASGGSVFVSRAERA